VDKFEALFLALETAIDELGIEDYGIQATSLEDVFLKVVEQADCDDAQESPAVVAPKPASFFSTFRLPFMTGQVKYSQLKAGMDHTDSDDESGAVNGDKNDGDEPLFGSIQLKDLPSVNQTSTDDLDDGQGVESLWDAAQLPKSGYHTGVVLFLQRIRAMLTKRLAYAKRDRKAVFSQILLPVFFILLAMLVATSFPPRVEMPPLVVTPSALYDNGCQGLGNTMFYNNANSSPAANLVAATKAAAQTPATRFLPLGGNLTDVLLSTRADLDQSIHGGISVDVQTHGSSYNNNKNHLYVRAWFDSRNIHSAPAYLNMAGNGLLRFATNNSADYSIETTNWPLNYTLEIKAQKYLESATDLIVAIFTIIALSFVPASFVVFLVHERVTKSKHLQFASGITPLTYWLSNFMWDFAAYVVSALCSLLIFVAFGLPSYTGRNLSSTAMLLIMYGFAIIPAMYPACFFFSVSSTAYVVLIVCNLFLGLTCTLTTSILDVFANTQGMEDLQLTNKILKGVFLLFPNYCLGRGILDTARNEYTAEAGQLAASLYAASGGAEGSASFAGFHSALRWDVAGDKVFCMLVQGVVFFAATLAFEYLRMFRCTRGVAARVAALTDPGQDLPAHEKEADVEAEADRVLAGRPLAAAPDVVHVEHLRKHFGRKQAVRDLSFGVAPGECFGLLGVNGAGKTTTFQMLTGDLAPASGDASISGLSLQTQLHQARQRFGYCPQFDALCDLLTGRETLAMFARVRGVPEKHVSDVTARLVKQLQLTRWADAATKVKAWMGFTCKKTSDR
jgi:hypothetical protein